MIARIFVCMAMMYAQPALANGYDAVIQQSEQLFAAWKTGNKLSEQAREKAFISNAEKANKLLYPLVESAPTKPKAYWMISRNLYNLGELMPEEDKEGRTKLYEEILRLMDLCLQHNPDDGNCLHFKATGMGRWATTQGVFKTISKAEDVEQTWLKAEKVGTDYVAPDGEPMINNVYYGLGIFYRMVPDRWIMQLLAGTRGSPEKSVEYFRKAVANQPNRIELVKELGASLLCFGESEDDDNAIEEGKKVLQSIVDGAYDGKYPRITDAIDKKHAADLQKQIDLACAYSRDGYQDIPEEE